MLKIDEFDLSFLFQFTDLMIISIWQHKVYMGYNEEHWLPPRGMVLPRGRTHSRGH